MTGKQYRYPAWARLNVAFYLLVTMWFLLTGIHYVITTPPDTVAAWAGLSIVLGVLAISATGLVRTQARLFSVISISEVGIHVHRWNREVQVLNWLDARELRPKGRHGAFEIRGGTPEIVIPVSNDLVGLEKLRKAVERKLETTSGRK